MCGVTSCSPDLEWQRMDFDFTIHREKVSYTDERLTDSVLYQGVGVLDQPRLWRNDLANLTGQTLNQLWTIARHATACASEGA
jgi:hypothetical protein